jgi:hypothetical protein
MRHLGETLKPVRVLKIIRNLWLPYSPFASALGCPRRPSRMEKS